MNLIKEMVIAERGTRKTNDIVSLWLINAKHKPDINIVSADSVGFSSVFFFFFF